MSDDETNSCYYYYLDTNTPNDSFNVTCLNLCICLIDSFTVECRPEKKLTDVLFIFTSHIWFGSVRNECEREKDQLE